MDGAEKPFVSEIILTSLGQWVVTAFSSVREVWTLHMIWNVLCLVFLNKTYGLCKHRFSQICSMFRHESWWKIIHCTHEILEILICPIPSFFSIDLWANSNCALFHWLTNTELFRLHSPQVLLTGLVASIIYVFLSFIHRF